MAPAGAAALLIGSVGVPFFPDMGDAGIHCGGVAGGKSTEQSIGGPEDFPVPIDVINRKTSPQTADDNPSLSGVEREGAQTVVLVPERLKEEIIVLSFLLGNRFRGISRPSVR